MAYAMHNSENRPISASADPAQWGASPSTKSKNTVQRSVTALLDALAPERLIKNVDRPQAPGTVEQHRTPSGCVLQATDCAVSVSWFPAATEDAVLGELHVLTWSGKVARRGVPRGLKHATLLSELVLRPIEPAVDDCVWSANGARYDNTALAAQVMSLLQTEIQTCSGRPDTEV